MELLTRDAAGTSLVTLEKRKEAERKKKISRKMNDYISSDISDVEPPGETSKSAQKKKGAGWGGRKTSREGNIEAPPEEKPKRGRKTSRTNNSSTPEEKPKRGRKTSRENNSPPPPKSNHAPPPEKPKRGKDAKSKASRERGPNPPPEERTNNDPDVSDPPPEDVSDDARKEQETPCERPGPPSEPPSDSQVRRRRARRGDDERRDYSPSRISEPPIRERAERRYSPRGRSEPPTRSRDRRERHRNDYPSRRERGRNEMDLAAPLILSKRELREAERLGAAEEADGWADKSTSSSEARRRPRRQKPYGNANIKPPLHKITEEHHQ